MAYAEKKAMYASTWCYGLLEWGISKENPQGNLQRPHGWSDGPSFGTVYSLKNTGKPGVQRMQQDTAFPAGKEKSQAPMIPGLRLPSETTQR